MHPIVWPRSLFLTALTILCLIVGAICAKGSAGNLNSMMDSVAGNATDARGGTGELKNQPGALVSYLGDPCYPDNFWKTATPEESAVDKAGLAQALERIANARLEIHSFLLVRNGRIVFEQYGWKTGRNADDPDKTSHQVVPNERHLIHSTTKSITSTLVGTALRDGLIASLDDRVVSYFPEYQPLPKPSADKNSITLKDLLTMRSGLQYTEGVDDQAVFFNTPNPAQVMLSRPVVETPVGEIWNYSSGDSDIIAAVLRKVTGKTPLDYANKQLFDPLGLVGVPWQAAGNGTNHGGWGLALTPREMARFGELYRNHGLWNGKQIVPADWTNVATSSHCQTPWNGDYGYHFWVPNLPGVFGTRGAYGQNIYVSRERGLVVVFTADLPIESADQILDALMRDLVIPAVK